MDIFCVWKCHQCLKGFDNLCGEFQATGRDVNGGYAEYMVATDNYAFPIPEFISNAIRKEDHNKDILSTIDHAHNNNIHTSTTPTPKPTPA